MKLATLCYLKQAGKTLMIHRSKRPDDIHAGKWNGLGGKFEPGETPEECVIREVREESGLTIKNPVLHGFLTFPGFAHEEDWYAFVFTASDFEGQLVSDSPAEGFLEWVDNQQLLNLDLWEGDRIFLPWLDSNRFFSGKFKYIDGRLAEHDVIFYPL